MDFREKNVREALPQTGMQNEKEKKEINARRHEGGRNGSEHHLHSFVILHVML